MSRNIESWSEYDSAGVWCLKIKKKRGKLTLDEITDVCREWDEDFYMLVIKAIGEYTEPYYETDDLNGDFVTLYRADKFFEWRKK